MIGSMKMELVSLVSRTAGLLLSSFITLLCCFLAVPNRPSKADCEYQLPVISKLADLLVAGLRACRAKTVSCTLLCTLLGTLEYAPNKWIGPLLEGSHGAFQQLEVALDQLREAGHSMDDTICDKLVRAMCRISVKLATAFTEQVTFLVATWDGSQGPLELLRLIGSTEAQVVKLLAHSYNDRQDVAWMLCQIGHQKIRVLAELAEVLTRIHEAPFQGDVQEEVRWDPRFRFHVQEVLPEIWPGVERLAQHLPNLDFGLRDEARTVLLGIRSLVALPILAQGADAWHTSLWKDLVVGRLGQHFEVHASFPALGMRPTSEDLQEFKDQARFLGNEAITLAVSPSVTVDMLPEEGNGNLLQRKEPESRSEVGAVQQVPAAGSWTLCPAAPASCQEASSADSRTIFSSSSSWTWDVVDS